jgi:hypothetical protein
MSNKSPRWEPKEPHQHDYQQQQFWRSVKDIDGLRWFWVQRCVCGDEVVTPDSGPVAPPPQDTERLDFLDAMNARKNIQNGTTYGWRLTENHNRIALEDHAFPALSVRDAIDEARRDYSDDIGTRTWACGASATGPLPLPIQCPVHSGADSHGSSQIVDNRGSQEGNSTGDHRRRSTITFCAGGSPQDQSTHDGEILQGAASGRENVSDVSRVGLSSEALSPVAPPPQEQK